MVQINLNQKLKQGEAAADFKQALETAQQNNDLVGDIRREYDEVCGDGG